MKIPVSPVFAANGCAGCHALEAAGASGAVGPNLDESQPDLALVVERVTNGAGLSHEATADVVVGTTQTGVKTVLGDETEADQWTVRYTQGNVQVFRRADLPHAYVLGIGRSGELAAEIEELVLHALERPAQVVRHVRHRPPEQLRADLGGIAARSAAAAAEMCENR